MNLDQIIEILKSQTKYQSGIGNLFWLLIVGLLFYFFMQIVFKYLQNNGWSNQFKISSSRVYFNILYPAFYFLFLLFNFLKWDFSFKVAGYVSFVTAVSFIGILIVQRVLPSIGLISFSGLSEGDFLEVENYKGRLKKINLFRAMIELEGGESVYLPISNLANQNIVKLVKGIKRVSKIRFSLNGVKLYKSELDSIENLLLFSPYVARGTTVSVAVDNDFLEIHAQVLSKDCSDKIVGVIKNKLPKLQNKNLDD